MHLALKRFVDRPVDSSRSAFATHALWPSSASALIYDPSLPSEMSLLFSFNKLLPFMVSLSQGGYRADVACSKHRRESQASFAGRTWQVARLSCGPL